MVKFPDWADPLFVEKEQELIRDGDGWSRGLIKHTESDVTYDALIEHLAEFEREVQFYAYDEEENDFAYKSVEDMKDAESGYYVAEYTDGHFSGEDPSEVKYTMESTEETEPETENETETEFEYTPEEKEVDKSDSTTNPEDQSQPEDESQATDGDDVDIDTDSIDWSIDDPDDEIEEEGYMDEDMKEESESDQSDN